MKEVGDRVKTGYIWERKEGLEGEEGMMRAEGKRLHDASRQLLIGRGLRGDEGSVAFVTARIYWAHRRKADALILFSWCPRI